MSYTVCGYHDYKMDFDEEYNMKFDNMMKISYRNCNVILYIISQCKQLNTYNP